MELDRLGDRACERLVGVAVRSIDTCVPNGGEQIRAKGDVGAASSEQRSKHASECFGHDVLCIGTRSGHGASRSCGCVVVSAVQLAVGALIAVPCVDDELDV